MPLSALLVTRFEVIDESGRAMTRRPCSVRLSFQDDGRTLKVFVSKAMTGRAGESHSTAPAAAGSELTDALTKSSLVADLASALKGIKELIDSREKQLAAEALDADEDSVDYSNGAFNAVSRLRSDLSALLARVDSLRALKKEEEDQSRMDRQA